MKGLSSVDKDLELKLDNLLVRLDALGAPQVTTSATTGAPSPDFEKKLKEHEQRLNDHDASLDTLDRA